MKHKKVEKINSRVRVKLKITGKDSMISSSSISSADNGKAHIPRPEENKHRHIFFLQ
jgi:hypothetical protein